MTSHLIERARQAERELARGLRRSNAVKLFGFELVGAEEGRAVLRMRVDPKHMQIHGVVHGGVLAALADTAGGLASYMVLPRGTRLATVEMKINYLEPVDKGVLVAEARVLRKGKNFTVVDCDIHDPDGRLAAKALMTFSIGPVVPRRRR